MNILITGGAGFLGHGLIQALAPHHNLRIMDVTPFDTPHEILIGDVTSSDDCKKALQNIDALIIAHMAPRHPGIYDTPDLPFDINVKGCALLLQAAADQGIKKIVLISSITAVGGHQQAGTYLTIDLPFSTLDLYALTKACQEEIAQQYHLIHGLSVTILRPALVIDGRDLSDKYGNTHSSVNWQYIDRQDIGLAAHCALQKNDITCETFYLLGHPDAKNHAEMEPTTKRLNWTPTYDFSNFPDDPA